MEASPPRPPGQPTDPTAPGPPTGEQPKPVTGEQPAADPHSTDPHERIDGLRAWLAQVDRKLGIRTYALAAGIVLALAAAAVALVFALQLQEDSATNDDLQALKDERRHRTFRTRGVTLAQVAQDLRRYLEGWHAYFGFAEVPSPLKEVDSWIRRRLRCYVWKQWGRRRYRELRNRGVSQELAWNTSKSAHGPWRLSRSPALAIALPGRYFDRRGVPRLHRYDRRP